jgi:hypothetical protein
VNEAKIQRKRGASSYKEQEQENICSAEHKEGIPRLGTSCNTSSERETERAEASAQQSKKLVREETEGRGDGS